MNVLMSGCFSGNPKAMNPTFILLSGWLLISLCWTDTLQILSRAVLKILSS